MEHYAVSQNNKTDSSLILQVGPSMLNPFAWTIRSNDTDITQFASLSSAPHT